jgi:2-polyprenyl-3-methyl-5-hydroxy-6-metoxy-1,4-benzoquinol methylase
LFTVWRCTNCASLHSKEDAALPHYYRDYPLQRQELDPGLRIAYSNRLRLLKQRGLKRTSSILDFGCGSGAFVKFLQEQGYERSSGYDAYAEAYSDPSVLGCRYDLVVSYDVVEHAEDPRACFEEFATLLAPGGVLAIGTPNADHVSLKQRTAPELHQPYHRHILSERALTDAATKVGLEVEHVYRRLYIDSLYPGMNARFVWGYYTALGGQIDALTEPIRASKVFGSPKLLFWAFFGYFFPERGNILVSFRKPREAA